MTCNDSWKIPEWFLNSHFQTLKGPFKPRNNLEGIYNDLQRFLQKSFLGQTKAYSFFGVHKKSERCADRKPWQVFLRCRWIQSLNFLQPNRNRNRKRNQNRNRESEIKVEIGNRKLKTNSNFWTGGPYKNLERSLNDSERKNVLGEKMFWALNLINWDDDNLQSKVRTNGRSNVCTIWAFRTLVPCEPWVPGVPCVPLVP